MGDIANATGGAVSTDRPDAATGFEPIPTGWYPVLIESAEVKDNNAGNGKLLKLEQQIVGDKYSGRKLFTYINLQNPSQVAVEIGMKLLAALGQACGLVTVSDTTELVGKTVEARVVVRPAKNGYEASNEVTAYRLCGGAQAAPQSVTSPATSASPVSTPAPAQPAAAPKAKRPWER